MINRDGIERLMQNGSIVIEPFLASRLNPNSYDVCLGNWFIAITRDQNLPFSAPMYVPDGERVVLPQGVTILGMTKEIIGTRNNCVAELRSKSSTRRRGITICDDAGFGDVGYVNHWTVELTAHIPSGSATYLEAGMPFAQVVFFETDVLKQEYQYKGQYAIDDWPSCMIPKSYRDEWKKLYDPIHPSS